MNDLLARLIAAGTPADLVAEVAMELARATVAQEAIQQRRAKDRERQSRHRDNVTSRDITDVTGGPSLSRPPNEINSNPPTHTHPEHKPARVRVAHPLPDGWQPKTYPIGTETRKAMDAWPPGERELQVERFTAHHRKLGNQFKDWDAAWTTWATDRRQASGQNNQKFRGGGGAGPDKRSGLARAIDRELGEVFPFP